MPRNLPRPSTFLVRERTGNPLKDTGTTSSLLFLSSIAIIASSTLALTQLHPVTMVTGTCKKAGPLAAAQWRNRMAEGRSAVCFSDPDAFASEMIKLINDKEYRCLNHYHNYRIVITDWF